MKVPKIFLSRLFDYGLLMILQLIWLFLAYSQILEVVSWLNYVLEILSIFVVLWLVNKDENPSYKISWIILILVFPVLGGPLYLLIGNKRPSRFLRRRLEKEQVAIKDIAVMNHDISDRYRNDGLTYLKHLGFETYENTKTKYYTLGEYCYVDLLRDIKNAKHYILMEYFIICPGLMLDTILDLLKQKVDEGVKVRFMYDDFGSVSYLPFNYIKQIEALGIECVAFNPFKPVLSLAMNNRDHKKICVIDGYIGYSGGFNLADEYINAKQRFGHWKDTGIRLEGDGVWNLTTMFLTTWNAYKHEDLNYDDFKPNKYHPPIDNQEGFVVAYGDSPLDEERTGENIYANLINQAQEEILIMTPYFIIDDTMMKDLIIASRKGVSIKIITPGIPDKKTVYRVTRSYYYSLIKEGIEFYEYQPGFLHAKMVICDKRIATVGTINFDYRSFYLHFECNVMLTQPETIKEILADFDETLSLSKKISQDYSRRFKGFFEAVLRLFAPLL